MVRGPQASDRSASLAALPKRAARPRGRVVTPAGRQWQTVHSGSSYCSQSDLALIFGLGQQATAQVEIEWPSGKKQTVPNVKTRQHLEFTEQ